MGFMAERPGDEPMKRLEAGKYSHLVIAPIEMADFEPDIISLHGTPAQVMRLAQAARPSAGHDVSAIASGLADCGDLVARTTLTDECQCILPSGGDRVYGSTQDHEMIFTMPRSKVDAVMQGLEDTHKGGFRYPILTDLRYQPALAPFLQIPKDA